MSSVFVKTFDEWFSKENEAGLVDFKLAVTRGRGITTQAVRDEILNIEVLIETGRVKSLPEPITFIPKSIEDTICSVTI